MGFHGGFGKGLGIGGFGLWVAGAFSAEPEREIQVDSSATSQKRGDSSPQKVLAAMKIIHRAAGSLEIPYKCFV
jgi:hypothetical protein